MILLLMALPVALTSGPIDKAFQRLYNCDFAGAQAILEESISKDPTNPLLYSVRAATYLYGEMDRLRILETDFFIDDQKVATKKKLQPDPNVRVKFFQAVEDARRRANARLAANPNDRDALFALCMSASVVTDYTALVDRRQWRSVFLAKQTNFYAQKLLSLNPPFYDAHLTVGTVEYILASLPFYLRWLVHFDQIQGNKEKGIENLKQVAWHGQYYGPFAKILLAVVYLRENKPQEARIYLAEVARDYPENPLIRKELDKVNRKLSGGK
jgi:tetratricopeptide (TPR) repeat protein